MILDPKKLRVIISINFANFSESDVEDPYAGSIIKCGHPFLKNELTWNFGSKYRDPDTEMQLMGEELPLGKLLWA